MADRLRLSVRGAVQGVGFRPFVYRLAEELGLAGWCRNTAQGVSIEVEGDRSALEELRLRMERGLPPRAVIHGLEASWLDPAGYVGFHIQESYGEGRATAIVMPDIAICQDCRRELEHPGDRRHRYPFTNCTNCGPRFSILHALPYDRANTSMRAFTMCPDCRREYEDPANRRFHAEPNACPACGPQVALWNAHGETLAVRDDALLEAAGAIRAGKVVAVKGLGGFHLLADALNEDAVDVLRARKHREEKPFALMYPDLAAVSRHARLSADEARLLLSPESPIVLVEARQESRRELARSIAPGSRNLGVMLPYTPLHVLLLADLAQPVVATSGNRAEEPICTDERDAIERLHGIADLFLVHDRPIVRHVDDSIVRIMAGRDQMIRRARGYAPLPIPLPTEAPPIVGVGGHLKNTVAVAVGANIFVSQHIGDLETTQSTAAFQEVLTSLEALYRVRPEAVAVDLHPDYLSTRYGQSLGLPVTGVQHHYAHVAACMVDNDLTGTALGVVWDGSGYGTDGTVWGGEFLAVSSTAFTRVACLRPFRLPGGEQAVREPRRSALGVLWALGGATEATRGILPGTFTAAEDRVLRHALASGLNAPVTTSAGRLFDAVASIIGLRHKTSFEGQAAMELEAAIVPGVDDSYPFAIGPASPAAAFNGWQAPAIVADWGPAIQAIQDDVRRGVSVGVIAARFHNTLVEIIVGVSAAVAEPRVLLTGGCFQNRYLTERAVARLAEVGRRPYWHQRLPPNDGGVSVGQVAAVLRGRPAVATGTVTAHHPVEDNR